MLVLTAAVLVAMVCVVRRRRKKLLTPQPEQPMYDYVEPPDLPPDRIQLKENIAYGNMKPTPSGGIPVRTTGDLLVTKENEAYGQTETLQMKQNKTCRETGMLQMNENEAYQPTEIVIYL